jgi:hypothetical protein
MIFTTDILIFPKGLDMVYIESAAILFFGFATYAAFVPVTLACCALLVKPVWAIISGMTTSPIGIPSFCEIYGTPASIALRTTEEMLVAFNFANMSRKLLSTIRAFNLSMVRSCEKTRMLVTCLCHHPSCFAGRITKLVFVYLKSIWMSTHSFSTKRAGNLGFLLITRIVLSVERVTSPDRLAGRATKEMPISPNFVSGSNDQLSTSCARYLCHNLSLYQKAMILKAICLSCLGKGSLTHRIMAVWRQIKNCLTSLDTFILPPRGPLCP